MKLKSLIITSALLLAACGYTQAQSTQVIAHRGFWKTAVSYTHLTLPTICSV